METLGAILGILCLLVFIALFQGGIYHIMQKYFGVKVIPRFTDRKEYENQIKVKNQLNNLDSDLLKSAVEQTEKKGYSKTHENVLEEAIKIKNKAQKSNPYIFTPDKNSLIEAIKIVNNYYYDLQKDTDFLKAMSLEDVHNSIIKNASLESFLINNFATQELYMKNEITYEEYRNKRQIILSKAINNPKK